VARGNFDTDIGDLTQAIGRVVRLMRAAAAGHELSLTESTVLARLAREGPATTAELARGEAMKPQSMGAVIGTLEERGLVERTPHPSDGRQIHIRLTARGTAIRERTRDAKRMWLANAIAQLDVQEQETLFEAGRILRRLAEP
jgi:DNA-binding MarR family transcriptional regulator